ncbi:uncharacterized protein LOC113472388 [Diaphorina citri]|uniref:Uncharacterized protein LOC113472388 n=1 Tax=Diaphorina citri TaxID=121845 RepID=A0A3Q0JHN8_DIACI|nr:uncharacterized protein LOC113472388 [Diaphorina citri]
MTDSMICWILLGVFACVSCRPETEPAYETNFGVVLMNNGSKNDIGEGAFEWNLLVKPTKNVTISREDDKLKISLDLSEYSFKVDILSDNITTVFTFSNIETGQNGSFHVPNNQYCLLTLSQEDTLVIFNLTSSNAFTFNSDSEVTINTKEKFTVEKKKGKDDNAIEVTFFGKEFLNLPDFTIYFEDHSFSDIKYEKSGKIIEGIYKYGLKAWFPNENFFIIFRDNLKRFLKFQ